MSELSMSELTEKTKRKMDAVVKSFVLEIGSSLVQSSPVGDAKYWKAPAPSGYVGGRFKGNWCYGFSAAPTGEFETIDPGGDISNERINRGVLGNKAAGVHYVVNNLPYAQAIEDGHSGQAPTGVVSLTEIVAPQILREIVTNANSL